MTLRLKILKLILLQMYGVWNTWTKPKSKIVMYRPHKDGLNLKFIHAWFCTKHPSFHNIFSSSNNGFKYTSIFFTCPLLGTIKLNMINVFLVERFGGQNIVHKTNRPHWVLRTKMGIGINTNCCKTKLQMSWFNVELTPFFLYVFPSFWIYWSLPHTIIIMILFMSIHQNCLTFCLK